MIIPDMDKLYEPYSKSGGTLEGALRWLQKVTGAPNEIIESVVAETMLDIANGKSFEGDCECGCGLKNAHTKIEHHMRNRCNELKEAAAIAYKETVQKTIQAKMLAHIQSQNEQYIKENTKPPHPFLDWSRSETVKLINKMRKK